MIIRGPDRGRGGCEFEPYNANLSHNQNVQGLGQACQTGARAPLLIQCGSMLSSIYKIHLKLLQFNEIVLKMPVIWKYVFVIVKFLNFFIFLAFLPLKLMVLSACQFEFDMPGLGFK